MNTLSLKTKRFLALVLIAVLALALVGCGNKATEEPEKTKKPTTEATPTPDAETEATPTPEITPAPEATPTPDTQDPVAQTVADLTVAKAIDAAKKSNYYTYDAEMDVEQDGASALSLISTFTSGQSAGSSCISDIGTVDGEAYTTYYYADYEYTAISTGKIKSPMTDTMDEAIAALPVLADVPTTAVDIDEVAVEELSGYVAYTFRLTSQGAAKVCALSLFSSFGAATEVQARVILDSTTKAVVEIDFLITYENATFTGELNFAGSYEYTAQPSQITLPDFSDYVAA